MPSEASTAKASKTKTAQLANRSTRLLLALWESDQPAVFKGKLTSRLKQKDEKRKEYEDVYNYLKDEKKAIFIEGKKVALTPQGKELLGQHLRNADMTLEGTIVGAWLARALCKWIQQSEALATVKNGKVNDGAIASYEEFKPVALEVFDRLNHEYNYDNLVPIYRIRREIGESVSRSQFNDWMLELQANDAIQLVGGEMPSLTLDIAEDSIETKLGGIRYYAKRL